MTDKELLELAARAAGIFSLDVPIQDPYPHLWNPLTDPGDALRLAVACTVDIVFAHRGMTRVYAGGYEFTEYCEDDQLAATMRAITRAAAEIGRAKT